MRARTRPLGGAYFYVPDVTLHDPDHGRTPVRMF